MIEENKKKLEKFKKIEKLQSEVNNMKKKLEDLTANY